MSCYLSYSWCICLPKEERLHRISLPLIDFSCASIHHANKKPSGVVHFNISPTSKDDQDRSGQITGKCKAPSLKTWSLSASTEAATENGLWVKRVKSRVGQVRAMLGYPRHVGFPFKVCFYFMCMFAFVYICTP